MNGAELATFLEELNGGASIGDTLALQLLNLAKAMVEQQRPWMILRDTDTSITATAATNGWQTAIDLSTIARFNRFYGDCPVKNFDGNNRTDYYRQIPLQKRLQYREAAFTFAFNEGTKQLYLNGTVNPGTLWIDHIKDSPDIDDSASWVFPSWSHTLLGFFAVGIHKGGIDYDDVNARMSDDNRATAATILARLEIWDNAKQLAAQEQHDPSRGDSDGWRPGAININS